MICTSLRFARLTTLLSGIFVIAAFAPAQELKADHGPSTAFSLGNSVSGESSKDDQDEASPLVVTGDFNRDGIVDLAEITLPGDDPSEPGLLTVLLGQASGTFRKMASKPLLGRTPRHSGRRYLRLAREFGNSPSRDWQRLIRSHVVRSSTHARNHPSYRCSRL